MRDKDKEYDEFLDVWNKSKGNRPKDRRRLKGLHAVH